MMKIKLLFVAALIGIAAFGQGLSPYALVYKPGIDALKTYAENGDDNELLQITQVNAPLDTLWLDKDSNELPEARGVYLLVYTNNGQLALTLVNHKPWPVYVNSQKSRIAVRVFNDSSQTFIREAIVFEGNKGDINFEEVDQAFIFKKRFNRSGNLVIVHKGAPMWVDWDAMDDDYGNEWWYRFEYRLQDFWERLTDKDYRQERKEYRNRYEVVGQNMSYIATNKPLYRVGDTLKLKAFVLKKNDRAFNKPARLEVSYYDGVKRKRVEQVLDTLEPYRPGAFTYRFVVADTLLGKSLELSLLDKKSHLLQGTNVQVQDYTLNQIEFEAELLDEKGGYYPNVPLRIRYSAIDDLGLSAMEGRIQVEVKNNGAEHVIPKPVVVLPNILLDTTFQLDPTGRGIFTLPVSKMPEADVRFSITIKYVASNGETSNKNWYLNWYGSPKKLRLKHQNGEWLVVADTAFDLSGKAVVLEVDDYDRRNGSPYLKSNYSNLRIPIQLPYTLKQPIPQRWNIYVDDTLALLSSEEFKRFRSDYSWEVNENEVIYFREKPLPQQTIVQVYADGRDLVYIGPLVNDTLRLPANCRFYMIYPQEPNTYDNWMRYDLVWVEPRIKKGGADFLSLTADGPGRIYPGDTATWNLALKKGDKPVEDFDLLAMAYKKKQFDNTTGTRSSDTRVIRENVKYPRLKQERLPIRESGDAYLDAETANEAVTREWLKKLGADTLPEYKYMFPEGGVGVHQVQLPQGLNKPQFAPFVYRGGRQITVEAFYVASRVRFIKSITRWAYSSEVEPGQHTVVIRLYNQKITVPNVRMVTGFKTELAIDLENLPDSILVENMPSKYTDEELAHFRQYVLRFQFSGKYTLTQGNAQVVSNSQTHQNYGPFAPDKISFLGENLQLDFPFLGNQTLTLDRETRMLERKPMESYSVRPGFGWRYGASGVSVQVPGMFLQLPPEPPKQPDYTYYSIPVVNRPTATFPDVCKLTSMGGYLNNNAYYFAYCSNRKELYQIQVSELRGYSRSTWLPGTYQLFMVEESKAFISPPFTIHPDQTAYADFEQFAVADVEPTLELLRNLADSTAAERARVAAITRSSFSIGGVEQMGGPTASLYGVVKDKYTGETVPFANIVIKQRGVLVTGGITDLDGNYRINPISPGTYDVTCSFAGYATVTITDVTLPAGTKRRLDFSLSEESEMLMEVVTVASASYIEVGKTSTVVTAEEIKNLPYRAVGQIAATTAGVAQADDGMVFRGARGNNNQVFIDGVKVRGDVNIPRDALQVFPGQLPAQYGDVTGGVVQLDANGDPIGEADEVLNTLGSRGGNVRNVFRDYAFFIPDVTTDANGQARIKVNYPDDVANWQNYFIGMGSGGKYAFSAANTLAYSEVSAALATPRYLLRGDSCVLIGKTLNYLDTTLAITNYFTANGDTLLAQKSMLTDVAIHRVPVVASDALSATYSLKLKNGFVDGEQRTVPVLPIGLQESKGAFWVLQGDTTVEYEVDEEALINVGIMQTTTDFLLEEVDQQLRYVHNCNEQMASKLRAILAIQDIDAAAERRERDAREANKIINKLLENRNEDMLWGWWGKQETNAWMTTYVLESLLKAKAAGYQVDFGTSLQEAVDILATWKSVDRTNMLYAFMSVRLEAPYQFYMEKIVFDSLSVSGKLKYALVAEQNQLAYDTAAVSALFKKDMLGNTHVAGDDLYSLSGNMHNTLLGVEYLRVRGDESGIASCLNYMLLGRSRGDLNTIERAALTKALASDNKEQKAEGSIALRWDENDQVEIDESKTLLKRKARKVTLEKKGAGIVFASATVREFNPEPLPKNEDFKVQTSWKQQPMVGDENAINVTITPSAEARYVMLEIPIPAGCTVIDRVYSPYRFGNAYQEVKGDMVYVYINKVAGEFTWSIPVLPRYAGGFTVNPVKAELMYFPTKSGNDGVKRITVEQ